MFYAKVGIYFEPTKFFGVFCVRKKARQFLHRPMAEKSGCKWRFFMCGNFCMLLVKNGVFSERTNI